MSESTRPDVGDHDIGWAIRETRDYKQKVTRRAWPVGTFVVYQKAYPSGIPINKNTAEATGIPEGTVCCFLPYLMIYIPKERSFRPFTALTEDLLALDWTWGYYPS